MLTLGMRRSRFAGDAVEKLGPFFENLPDDYRPVLKKTLEFQAESLGVPASELRPGANGSATQPAARERLFAEILSTAGGLIAVDVVAPRRTLARVQQDAEEERASRVFVYGVGDDRTAAMLDSFCALLAEHFDIELEPFAYDSDRMDELKDEGMTPSDPPAADELAGARLLADGSNRTAAVAIASSGGLLVSDLPKQLPEEKQGEADPISEGLQAGGLVASELLVICRRTSAQVARVPDRDALEEMARRGLKCACGREISAERIESALTVTSHGRKLLDGSRWLSVLVTSELIDLGIPVDRILIEQKAGDDEMDCFADINGELVFFELKDKEFNLGNAYSFGAKIGISRPDHSVIVTSAYVGNDAKEHFQKAEESAVQDRYAYLGSRQDTPRGVVYIEGIEGLRSGLEDLVGQIYAQDAERVLSGLLPHAAVEAHSLVGAIAREPTQTNQPVAEAKTS
jgi:hypothetical protein